MLPSFALWLTLPRAAASPHTKPAQRGQMLPTQNARTASQALLRGVKRHRRAHARVFDCKTFRLEHLLQRGKQQQDIVCRAAGAHEPNAPDLASEHTQTATDFNITFMEQAAAHACIVH